MTMAPDIPANCRRDLTLHEEEPPKTKTTDTLPPLRTVDCALLPRRRFFTAFCPGGQAEIFNFFLPAVRCLLGKKNRLHPKMIQAA